MQLQMFAILKVPVRRWMLLLEVCVSINKDQQLLLNRDRLSSCNCDGRQPCLLWLMLVNCCLVLKCIYYV